MAPRVVFMQNGVLNVESVSSKENPLKYLTKFPKSIYVDHTDLPDMKYRPAWEFSVQPTSFANVNLGLSSTIISVNMTSAREIRKNDIRRERQNHFTNLDKLYIEAISKSKNVSQITTRQQYLRDLPSDPSFDSATSTTELDAIEISSWSEPDTSALPDAVNPQSILTENNGVLTLGTTEKIVFPSDITIKGRISYKLYTNTISDASNVTYTVSQLSNGVILRDCGSSNRTDTTATATEIVNDINDCEVGHSYEFIVRNTSTAYRVITIAGGTDVTTEGQMTITTGKTKRFLVVVTNVGTPAVTIYSMNDVEKVMFKGNFTNVFSSNKRYLSWNNNTEINDSMVNGLWIGRSGKIVELNTLYLFRQAITSKPNTYVHFDIGKIDGNDPNNDKFISLQDDVVVWDLAVVGGTFPEEKSNLLSIQFSETDKLSVRIREVGNVKQTKADVNIILIVELD